MRCTKVLTVLSFLLGTACGTQKSAPQTQGAPAPSAALTQPQAGQSTAVPQAAIVRVPVSATGDVTGQPELRAYTGTVDLSKPENLNVAFEGAAPAQNLVTAAPAASELDKDTSVQAWGCWGSRSSCGGWGQNYWAYNYRPTYYWGGSGYNYGYVNYYPCGGYNYYYYRPCGYSYGYGGRQYY